MTDSHIASLRTEDISHEMFAAEDAHFSDQVHRLIGRAEDFRMEKMLRHSKRTSVSLVLGMLLMLAGASGFGWYFLVEGRILMALTSLILSIALPALLHYWAAAPIRSYRREFKTLFMPDLAKALGGLKFYPSRGISETLVKKSGILSSFDHYKAEDCFMGQYNGVRVILSEARLSLKKRAVFRGIFVLLDTVTDHFEGMTIITADPALKKHAAKTLRACAIANPIYAGRLSVFTNQSAPSPLASDERLMKELYEMSQLFEEAPLSAIFWQKRHAFIAIPYDCDMFECSNLFVPITTHSTALQCKKEIEQLLSIIDVVKVV